MITGFNTDVEHDGVTYHVQTEDKGLASPLILSLVYRGGAILASKRTPYDDLIAAGFDEAALTERLQRQHKLICAAIHAGRIEDLRRMGASAPAVRDDEAAQARIAAAAIAPAQANGEARTIAREEPAAIQISALPAPPVVSPPPVAPPQPKTATHTVRVLKDGLADFMRTEAADFLHIALLDEAELRAGSEVNLHVRLSRRADGGEPVADADVKLKILGTSFRPLIVTAKTDGEGIARFQLALPHFTRGRAALLISAIVDGYEAEMRRIIHAA